MVIREAGLLFRGYSLVNKRYYETSNSELDDTIRNGLLTALLTCAESAFSANFIEYFEGNKFVITFIEDEIQAIDSVNPESIIAYAIIDEEKKIEKYIHKVIQPMLKQVINEFKKKYNKENLSKVSQFREFKDVLEKIFGMEVKKIDDRLQGIFY